MVFTRTTTRALIVCIIICQLLADNYCHALAKPLVRRIRSAIAPFTLPWYENGLDFSCTGCGKCCKVDGDVWLAPEEVDSIMTYLGYNTQNDASIEEFRKKYVRAEVTSADGDQSQSWMCLKRKEGACVFLDPVGKCGIYDVRPIQCSKCILKMHVHVYISLYITSNLLLNTNNRYLSFLAKYIEKS